MPCVQHVCVFQDSSYSTASFASTVQQHQHHSLSPPIVLKELEAAEAASMEAIEAEARKQREAIASRQEEEEVSVVRQEEEEGNNREVRIFKSNLGPAADPGIRRPRFKFAFSLFDTIARG